MLLHLFSPVQGVHAWFVSQLIAERDRLNKDLEMAHSAIKQLEAELDNLQVGYGRGSSRR
jgi:cell division protein FtsB